MDDICNNVAFSTFNRFTDLASEHVQAMKTPLLRQKTDYVGNTDSLLCIIYWLFTPILVMTSTLLNHDALRAGFLSLGYPLIGVNMLIVYSASRHTSTPIKTILWTCLALFAAGLLLEDIHEAFEYLTYAASLGLVVTHLVNIRFYLTHHVH